MKSSNYFLPLIIIFIIISACERDETAYSSHNNNTKVIISADKSDTLTKSSLDNLSFSWTANDNLSLFSLNSSVYNNDEFAIEKAEGTFTSNEIFSGYVTDWVRDLKDFYAVYPYNSYSGYFDKEYFKYQFYLPTTQTQSYNDGVLDPTCIGKYLYMIGTSKNVSIEDALHLSIKFYHITSILDINLTGLQGRTVHKLKIIAPTDLFQVFTTVNFDTREATFGGQSSTMAIEFDGAPSGNITGRIAMFPITIPNGTQLKFAITVKESDGTYKYYVVNKEISGGDIVFTAGKRKTTSVVVPNTGGIDVISEPQSANCYIADSDKEYCFDGTVIGNGDKGLLDMSYLESKFHTYMTSIKTKSVGLLWEDVDGLIKEVSYSDGLVHFKTAYPKQGNAVLAAYSGANCTGDILWSWHIWCVNSLSTRLYKNYNGIVRPLLDKNLGATSCLHSTEADLLNSFGLLYECGRKDPFPGSASFNDGVEKNLYGAVTSIKLEEAQEHAGGMLRTIRNPATFYYKSTENRSFVWDIDDSHYFWGINIGTDGKLVGQKTIYDPCPPGYMLPPDDVYTGFTTDGFRACGMEYLNVQGTFDCGWTMITIGEATSWYPAAGYRSNKDGKLVKVGIQGRYWTAAIRSTTLTSFSGLYFADLFIAPEDNMEAAYGMCVRCMQYEQK